MRKPLRILAPQICSVGSLLESQCQPSKGLLIHVHRRIVPAEDQTVELAGERESTPSGFLRSVAVSFSAYTRGVSEIRMCSFSPPFEEEAGFGTLVNSVCDFGGYLED